MKGRSPTPTHVLTSSPTWGRLGPCMSGPGLILGAPPASSCPGACGSSFSEGLTPEGTQTSWDKDIPAINQGEGTVSWGGGVQRGVTLSTWCGENSADSSAGQRR